MAALHGLIGEVGDGVDRLSADDGGGFMKERVKEDALECFYSLGTEMVVESDTLGGGGAEEEASEENEGEGAHLRGKWRREDKVKSLEDGEGLTTSVSAEEVEVRSAREPLFDDLLVAVGRVQGLRSMRGQGTY